MTMGLSTMVTRGGPITGMAFACAQDHVAVVCVCSRACCVCAVCVFACTRACCLGVEAAFRSSHEEHVRPSYCCGHAHVLACMHALPGSPPPVRARQKNLQSLSIAAVALAYLVHGASHFYVALGIGVTAYGLSLYNSHRINATLLAVLKEASSSTQRQQRVQRKGEPEQPPRCACGGSNGAGGRGAGGCQGGDEDAGNWHVRNRAQVHPDAS